MLKVIICLAVFGIGFAPTARADQFDYVAMLDSNGVYYADIVQVINLGKQVCQIVRTNGTPDGIGLANNMLKAAGFNAGADRGLIVTSAATNMCPDILPQVQAWRRRAPFPNDGIPT